MKHWEKALDGWPARGDGARDCFGRVVACYVRRGAGGKQLVKVGEICATCGTFVVDRTGLVPATGGPDPAWAVPEVKRRDAAWAEIGGPLTS